MILDLVIVALLAYQVWMPAVDNAKYTIVVHDNKLIRMNTQNGKMEVCDAPNQCEDKK